MQLFTIGTVKLNLDGSKALDGNGNPIPTYNNEETSIRAHMTGTCKLGRASKGNLCLILFLKWFCSFSRRRLA